MWYGDISKTYAMIYGTTKYLCACRGLAKCETPAHKANLINQFANV